MSHVVEFLFYVHDEVEKRSLYTIFLLSLKKKKNFGGLAYFKPTCSRFQEEGMTHRTHAVAKTRAHQVRWSSRCRSRTAGAGARAAAGARGAAAAGRGRTTQLRLSSASTLVDGSPQLQRSSHALLRPQESKCSRTRADVRQVAR